MNLVDHMNQKLKLVKPSPILSFSVLADQTPGAVNFTVGEPDFATPEHVKEAAITSIQANRSHYAPSNGISELKEAASNFLKQKYDQDYSPEEIIVTCGASEAIYTIILSVLNAGEKVLIPTPCFPLYIADTMIAGGQPVLIDTSATDFKLTPDLLQETLDRESDSVRLLVLNYPVNPTGVTYSQEELNALADVVRGRDIFLMCDEIYSELNYDQKHASLAKTLPEQTILVTGVSKSHAMTGWRIGLLCAPKAITQELGKIHQFTITTAATVTQDAAREALENGPDDCQPMKAEYQKRRDYIMQVLTNLGFTGPQPRGAFYIFTQIPQDLNQDDVAFAQDLLQEGKVAAVPGSYFGPGGEGCLRFSYATSQDNVERGMKLLQEYVQKQRAAQ
ncbi:aminotransferase class I/II-fold pyridoxal phosphate-dependent enzyme [Lactobacillus sp. DCY120]|uniref:Aminotransferase n=1 Tax=Bombilactobacillus apium TaxID=2675299 RepID=A0A850R0D5_9LACO|nr:aminotransferase class I/II-fold pyridoxal phosphate-dependent enzyme [Bombilactobacillus apium]NVY96393.1 aminotransferase class I/II-fold pyridoxal phosphate-dependent enzyme [Bombilactobacillus apium]